MGEMSLSKEEEISAIEKEEGEKMYKLMYIRAWKPQEDYNRGREGQNPNT